MMSFDEKVELVELLGKYQLEQLVFDEGACEPNVLLHGNKEQYNHARIIKNKLEKEIQNAVNAGW